MSRRGKVAIPWLQKAFYQLLERERMKKKNRLLSSCQVKIHLQRHPFHSKRVHALLFLITVICE